MKGISLRLMTARGDELGRLTLGEVQIAAAGEVDGRGNARSPDVAGQMRELYASIGDALAREGMMVLLDRRGLQLAVCQALISPPMPDKAEQSGHAEEEILISLPVREAPASAMPPSPSDPTGADAPPPELTLSGELDWDMLFDLDEPGLEQSHLEARDDEFNGSAGSGHPHQSVGSLFEGGFDE